ncbi:MAG: hypothetical protein H6867_04370 [Rhodospirillales bacterium]|nr:hypothetical protein [Rhodospirillales bacterium]MCB9996385.1 hypothetical protein [Rhodospirillales bacterium]
MAQTDFIDVEPLRETFAQYCGHGDGTIKPVKTIMMVGAVFNDRNLGFDLDSENDPFAFMDDKHYLQSVLAALKDKNIPVDPDFEIDVVNIKQEYGGLDFLNPQLGLKADLIISCFIYAFNGPNGKAYAKEVAPWARATQVSPNHFDKDAWYDAAERTGAFIIATIGSLEEISLSQFEHSTKKDNYQLVHNANDTKIMIDRVAGASNALKI